MFAHGGRGRVNAGLSAAKKTPHFGVFEEHGTFASANKHLSAVFRVRSVAAFAIHAFFNERGFVYAHSPIITTSDCEGAGEMFRVTTLDAKEPPMTPAGEIDYAQDFFGRPTSLTVSVSWKRRPWQWRLERYTPLAPLFELNGLLPHGMLRNSG
jgi:aspartyl/asparaginyl-tRNA synthetase